jgi:TonB family protein
MPEEDGQPPDHDDPELRFGSELLRRVLGKQPIEDNAWIACLDSNPECHLDSDFIESPLVDYLTPRERDAITKRNEANLPADAKAARKPAAAVPRLAQSDELALRLVTGLPRGLAQDLIRTGGCESTPNRRWISSAAIEFRSDGLPKHVSLVGTPPSTECRQVAETIFLMAMAPSDIPAPNKFRYLYVTLFDADCLACNEVTELPSDSAASPAQVYRVRAHVVRPKVKDKAQPIYPLEARKQKEEGVSIYEAVISRTGCVRDIRVLQSSYPLLDVSGMEAIAHWRYAPATLDGRPVSVCLTVTITYSLK